MSDANQPELKHVVQPGDVIGDRYCIKAYVADDPDWPFRAVELDGERCRVQLSIHVLGVWLPNDEADGEWIETYPQLRNRHALPQVSCGRLRYDGGVLSVAVTPDLPAALPGLLETSDPNDRLLALRYVHAATEPIELLHGLGDAHGSLSLTSFRLDEEQTCRLRLPGVMGSEDLEAPSVQHDLRALRRVIFAITDVRGRLPERGETTRYRPVFPDPGHRLKACLRTVLKTRKSRGKADNSIANWRQSLDRLIREIEVTLLSEHSRQIRMDVVRALLLGDLARALALTEDANDPWCTQINVQLTRRFNDSRSAFENWSRDQHDQTLHESAESLARLAASGFPLPDPDAVPVLRRRLSSSIFHLREAAQCVRYGEWDRAHRTLAAAAALDAGNSSLAAAVSLVSCVVRSQKENEP